MTAFPTVQGRCPACRSTTLFLGDGGHVTCSWIDCPDPCAADKLLHGEPPAAYRQLLPQLEADRAKMLRSASETTVEEIRIATSSLAAGYLHALAWAVRHFEGTEEAEAYIRKRAGGTATHDGPSIAECAAADKNWDVEKGGDQ